MHLTYLFRLAATHPYIVLKHDPEGGWRVASDLRLANAVTLGTGSTPALAIAAAWDNVHPAPAPTPEAPAE